MDANDLVFRTANEKDIDRLVEIHFAAYPSSDAVAEHERVFTVNPHGTLDDLFVAEDRRRSELVACGYLYPFEAHYGGRAVHVGGIASIAVAPEARGRGVASALVARLHEAADVRGDAITMLHAFREGFYDRLDYATTTPRKRLVLAPRAIPRAWSSREVTRAHGEHKEAIRDAHARFAARGAGVLSRGSARWDQLFLRPIRHHLVCGRSGYVAFHLLQAEANAKTTLEVEELVADDDATRRALFGALGAMRDQVAEIVIEVAIDDPIEHALVDMDAVRHGTAAVPHALGMLVSGPLVRIEDATRAIEARGYAGSGSFDVLITEEEAFSVDVEDGRASVSAARGRGALRTSKKTLAAILFGGLSATDAARLDLADADSRLLSRIDALVALPQPSLCDPF